MERLGRHSVRLKELRRRVRTRRVGEVIVDGRRLIEDLIRWGVAIRELYLAPTSVGDRDTEVWLAKSEAAWEVDASVLADIAPTKNPQGVLAVIDEPTWDMRAVDDGVTLYLEAVQDPGNLGAIVRSAAALGASAVLLSRGCVDPFRPSAVRGSAGAVLRLPVLRDCDVSEVVVAARQAGAEVWAAAGKGRELADWQPTFPLLLMLGAEGPGLRPASIALADGAVSIPLVRQIDSLNVAAAASILLYEVQKK